MDATAERLPGGPSSYAKATQLDVLRVVLNEPKLSGDVAALLWPDREFRRASRGGPTGGQRAAAGLLGKLKKRGLVRCVSRPDDPRTYWVATACGMQFLAENVTPRKALPWPKQREMG